MLKSQELCVTLHGILDILEHNEEIEDHILHAGSPRAALCLQDG
jgi:hypothetical protein